MATTPRLSLFRRHSDDCEQSYQKDFRIYEDDTIRRKNKKALHKDCSCTIYAEGKLSKGYLRPKATGENDWERAKTKADQWLEWGDTVAPPETPSPDRPITIKQAAEAYCNNKNSNLREDDTLKQTKNLTHQRLIPFAKARHIHYIQQMDNAEIWADFKNSWRNLNPLHNKTSRGQNLPPKPLGINTVGRLVTELRGFLRFCVSREWLSDNWATRKEHQMEAPSRTDPKEPFSDEELDYIYKATTLITDGKGFKTKRAGQQNGTEDLYFIWTSVYTGLRISDVTQLETRQLVPFEAGDYTHAIFCNPRKTRKSKDTNFVHIPIPGSHFLGHPNLVAALQSLPSKQGRYFFLGGNGSLKTNITSWRSRITKVFKLAEQLMARDGKQFSEHPHPHKYRHTFAARCLQGGMSLRQVAQYLGDTEVVVRRHYAKFCIAEQREAAISLATAMRKNADVATANKAKAFRLVKS